MSSKEALGKPVVCFKTFKACRIVMRFLETKFSREELEEVFYYSIGERELVGEDKE